MVEPRSDLYHYHKLLLAIVSLALLSSPSCSFTFYHHFWPMHQLVLDLFDLFNVGLYLFYRYLARFLYSLVIQS